MLQYAAAERSFTAIVTSSCNFKIVDVFSILKNLFTPDFNKILPCNQLCCKMLKNAAAERFFTAIVTSSCNFKSVVVFSTLKNLCTPGFNRILPCNQLCCKMLQNLLQNAAAKQFFAAIVTSSGNFKSVVVFSTLKNLCTPSFNQILP